MDNQEYQIIRMYRTEITKIMRQLFPEAKTQELVEAIDFSMVGKMKNSNVVLENIYKDKTINTSLADIVDYIVSREPILTPYGVMFKKPEDEENHLIDLTVQKFLSERKINKNKMFTYPKGSEEYNKYNLLQLLNKIDANGFYGATGNSSCLFYNLNVAASTTAAGRSAISVAGMAFESFLANNVKFRRLNEIILFINNVEKEERKFFDHNVLDKNIPLEMVFEHLISTCGHGYTPTEEDLDVVWTVLMQKHQVVLNRIFYKNNLFAFMANTKMDRMMITLLKMLKSPYLDPNKIPKEISVEMQAYWELLEEFVFYNHGYIDRIDRLTFLPRKATAIIDTDSNIVILDPWFQYWRNRVKDEDIHIKKMQFTIPFDIMEKDEFGDLELEMPFEVLDPDLDFDFDDDEIIEMKRHLDPTKVIPEDGLRYSIINILAFCLSKMVNKTMVEYTKHTNSYRPDKPCKLVMKNEFLFKTLLITEAKKNYASKIELQEGNIVKDDMDSSLDIKGLPLNKSTLNVTAQEKLQKILYEDILNDPDISPIKVVRKLRVVERQIYNSLNSGEKKFYKPLTVKSIGAYEDPMRISGIKASLVWNVLRSETDESFDLNTRNSMDVVKVMLDKNNMTLLQQKHPDIFNKLSSLLSGEDITGNITDRNLLKRFNAITAIAIPLDNSVPEWVLDIIDYNTIINDNLKNFSGILSSLGIRMVKNNVNYTNIINL